MTTDLIVRFEKRFDSSIPITVDFTQSTRGLSVTAVLGPSGCGKTTLLRCIAGLTQPDQGHIEFAGQVWLSVERKICRSPQGRDIGFLFQEYALFPHMTVAENIGFGIRGDSYHQRRQRLSEIISLFDLKGLEGRLPGQISGGQQQRVALARVLARRPRLLLLDEPLSALDLPLRERLRNELRTILSEFAIPVILVTHDRTEAIGLADRVMLMDQGAIRQIGSVADVFSRPQNADLARMVGIETVTRGEVVSSHEGLATVQVGKARLLALAPTPSAHFVHVCIKGEDVALKKGVDSQSSVRNHLPATIKSLMREGPLIRVTLDCGFELTALVTRPASEELQLREGDAVIAMVKAPAIHLIPCGMPPRGESFV